VLEGFRGDATSLGARNVEVAFEQLGAEQVPVVGSDVGGHRGRRLMFHVHTGAAWVRPIEMKS
jgi:chemotaxis protein CheD